MDSSRDPLTKYRIREFLSVEYRDLLYAVGRNSNPIEPSKLEKINGKYTYKMIEKLCPAKEEELFLLQFDEKYIKENLRTIVRKLNLIFPLKLLFKQKSDLEYDRESENLAFAISKIRNKQELVISDNESKLSVIISLQQSIPEAMLSIVTAKQEGRARPLIVKIRRNKFLIYVEIVNIDSLTHKRYLDVSLRPTRQKEVENILNVLSNPNSIDGIYVELIKNDRRNWRYRLNIRGFILYLFLESRFKKHDPRRVRKVIANFEQDETMQLLLSSKILEKVGFNVQRTLMKISEEFINQLETETIHGFISGSKYDDDILFRLIERYYSEIYRHFERADSIRPAVAKDDSKNLDRYHLYVQKYLEHQYKLRIHTVEKLFRYHSGRVRG